MHGIRTSVYIDEDMQRERAALSTEISMLKNEKEKQKQKDKDKARN